jgi:hypothetical protein
MSIRNAVQRTPFWFWLALIGLAYVIGYRASPVKSIEWTPVDRQFSDWHVRVFTNQYGLYVVNTGTEPLKCSLLPGSTHVDPNNGFWLRNEPGPFFQCEKDAP